MLDLISRKLSEMFHKNLLSFMLHIWLQSQHIFLRALSRIKIEIYINWNFVYGHDWKLFYTILSFRINQQRSDCKNVSAMKTFSMLSFENANIFLSIDTILPFQLI